MKWQAVFFDFDGVVLDSTNIKTEAFAEMFRQYGSEIESKVVDYHLAHSGVSRFEKFRYFYKNLLNKPIDEDKVKELSRQFSSIALKKILKAPFIEGALETLVKLKSMNIPSYIVSATPENEIRYILKKRNLEKYFYAAHGAPKAKDMIVDHICRQFDYNPAKCLYFGDAMSDYLAAQKNRTKFVGIVPKGTKSPFPAGTKTSPYVCFHLE